METRRGNFIKEHRLRAGLSQRELAEKVDLNLTSINRYENGNRGVSRKTILNLATALGIQPHELFVRPRELCNQNS